MSKRFDSSLLFSVDDLIDGANCHAVIVAGSEDRPTRVEIYEAGCSPEDQGDGPVVVQVEYFKSGPVAMIAYGSRSVEVVGSQIRQAIEACDDYQSLDEYMTAIVSEYSVEEVGDDREERSLNVEFMKGSGVYE